MSTNPLGQTVDYPQHYQPELLVAIPRSENREKLHIGAEINGGQLPFHGADIWNAYELSWLNMKGKPQAGIGRITFPSISPNIIESKSLKLYLNSLNQERYVSADILENIITEDISRLSGERAEVQINHLAPQAIVIEAPDGLCLDELDIAVDQYHPKQALLRLEGEGQAFDQIVDEVLYTNLFRSNCPITNQPDWATVTVCYRGKKISHAGLLKYLMSYRLHNDYHENCVETIFQDIKNLCTPEALTVEANFLRRGGLDINPVRTTEASLNYQNFPRFIRQ